jgi:Cdc6-like AAA superfamily ATPase
MNQFTEKILRRIACYFPEEQEYSSKTKEENHLEGSEDREVSEEEAETNKKKIFLSDTPASEDLLNFKTYVQAFTDLIVDRKIQTPITIGILGPWGSGKTTLMRMIEKEIKDHDKIDCIFFNAWKYDKEDSLRRVLILRVLEYLRTRTSVKEGADDKLEETILKLEKRLYDDVEWEEKGKFEIDLPKLLKGSSKNALKLSLSMASNPFVFSEIIKKANISVDNIADNLNSVFDAFQRQTIKHRQAKLIHIEQFQKEFSGLIESHFGDRVIVIFIDDMDRCLPDKVIDVLESIKLFMDVKGCIFFLGIDQNLIASSVESRYAGKETSKKDFLSGFKYLEKIVQMQFVLPALELSSVQSYVSSLNVEWPEGQQECANVFSKGLMSSPRQIKRAINNFLFAWQLVVARDFDTEDCITPVRLAKLAALQTMSPKLFNSLRDNPIDMKFMEYSLAVGFDGPPQISEQFSKELESLLGLKKGEDNVDRYIRDRVGNILAAANLAGELESSAITSIFRSSYEDNDCGFEELTVDEIKRFF